MIYKKNIKTVKIILFIQGGLLLLSTIFFNISEYKQEDINNEITKVNSRFLELIQQENSISDSRLEFIEMILIKDRLKLNDTQISLFNDNIKNITERYNKKIEEYNPNNYRNITTSTNKKLEEIENKKDWFKSFSLLFTILAFFINVYSVWKLKNFPSQSSI